MVSGCGAISTYPTNVRNLPGEVRTQLFSGDTRQKVRPILNTPLVDARNLGLEVYRDIGRDLDITLPGVPIPVPTPGQKVIVITLVVYDDRDLVKELATELWIPGHSLDFWITAGGYSFVNIDASEPETLLAPPVSWDTYSEGATANADCALVLMMGECPMEKVYLDNSLVVDLSPAGGYCGMHTSWSQKQNNYYGTVLLKRINPASHRLNISQKAPHGDFETVFECQPGDKIFAELEAHTTVPDLWFGVRLQGEISINKNIPSGIAEMDELRPILWHRGKWLGPSHNRSADSQ